MDRLTLDPTILARLGDSQGAVEVCDAAGKTVGFFVPSKAFYASIKAAGAEEKVDKRDVPSGGRTWPEIRADLEKKYGAAG